jgi:hypothetical protein
MSILAVALGEKKTWQWIAAAGIGLLIWGAMTLPRTHEQGLAIPQPSYTPMSESRESQMTKARSDTDKAAFSAGLPDAARDAATAGQTQALGAVDAAAARRMIRSSSLEMVVQHPADVAEKITALAERFGGYLETSDGGGENAATGMLTIRVPAEHFEQALAGIRKLGVRVETEKVNEQDVTRQYVDQDATLRNLHAMEAQYLTILKQAGSVKDLLAVSEKLSEVRGQIERQQAEFNALSKQTETVAIAISLHTEAEAQVFGLNWRPGYQMKLALRDGLESLATYATAMTTIVFYLPAMLLWVGTILAAIIVSTKVVRWSGRRWLGWSAAEPAAAK